MTKMKYALFLVKNGELEDRNTEKYFETREDLLKYVKSNILDCDEGPVEYDVWEIVDNDNWLHSQELTEKANSFI